MEKCLSLYICRILKDDYKFRTIPNSVNLVQINFKLSRRKKKPFWQIEINEKDKIQIL